MAYRNEIDITKLNQREKDFLDMIDRKLFSWLEDSKNWRMYSSEEVRKHLKERVRINKSFFQDNVFSNNQKVWVI